MSEKERVIFRREYDPYMKINKVLCCFPDDKANDGNIATTSFYIDEHGNTWFEPYSESSLEYFYSCKIIKDIRDRELFIRILEDHFKGSHFKSVLKRI